MIAQALQPMYTRSFPRRLRNDFTDPDKPEPDFEALQRLLQPYDAEISLERAKEIGGFLLRVYKLVNTTEEEIKTDKDKK